MRSQDAAAVSPMADGLLQPEFELLSLLLLGAVLAVVIAVASRVGKLMPMRATRRALWRRVEPLVVVVAFLLYLLFSIRIILRHSGTAQLVAFAIAGLTLVVATFPIIRDVLAGVIVRVDQNCQAGDALKLPDVEGRVTRLGLWSLEMETRDGQEALIPYGRLLRNPIIKNPVVQGGVLHVFRLVLQTPQTMPEVRRLVVETALSSYWASPVRNPLIRALSENEFEVTVFALHADYGSMIESDIKRALP